ncbi:L-carnitine dehydratase/bile acid-inducible protein F [marine gamma proteobacterium HTCC2143]|jgi:crotonobetainyl-CoA:carnitine CoA-transferase CaiB-like acyl-CoA transferase|uniref:L-carnitine dehydratase/bile acid-inducible protein F n=1 Tax=marine gamma proteobacterium HTCC2143 TaxID=247633 RepID=A0YBS2_9GAMM|nr:L-carnitine dehydratase/bile acid-inducible protein F [marine gamma proteobacterium HTCC2143]
MLPLPLEGIKVIEFSTMITASLATMMMAEQGADVIKVEPIEMGDPLRYFGTSKGGSSGLFANCNRGKQSIRINLKTAQGRDIVAKLVAKADVLINNFRPDVMDNLGFGSELMRSTNKRLVYVAISGFGTVGPMRNAPAYDPVIQAKAGIASLQGQQSPTFMRTLMCDKITAYTASQATTAALFQRERCGTGQHIDISMLDASMSFIFPDGYMNHTLLDDDIEQKPLLADQLYNPIITANGALTVSAATQKQRSGLFSAMGQGTLIADPRFNSIDTVTANLAAYQQIIADAFVVLDTDDAIKRLEENDVPCAKCLTADEVIDDSQLAATQSFTVIEHPKMGKMRVMLPAAKFQGLRARPGSLSPSHGEHTLEVLASIGISHDTIEELRTAGVIAD